MSTPQPPGKKPKGTDDPIDLKTADARTVLAFHRNSDLDSRPEAQHHALGKGRNQACEGGHTHDGTTSNVLLSATITGSRANNMASIMDQLLTELTKLGITNATTP
jgi:hypothetical protein